MYDPFPTSQRCQHADCVVYVVRTCHPEAEAGEEKRNTYKYPDSLGAKTNRDRWTTTAVTATARRYALPQGQRRARCGEDVDVLLGGTERERETAQQGNSREER